MQIIEKKIEFWDGYDDNGMYQGFSSIQNQNTAPGQRTIEIAVVWWRSAWEVSL